MPTRAFTDLLPKVLPSVPGCPQPLAVQHIRDAAIRACERTLMWRYVQPKYQLLPGVFDYEYAKPVDTEVHVVFRAFVNDSPLEVLTLEQALDRYPEWADIYSGEDPSVVWSLTPPSYTGSDVYDETEFNPGSAFVLPPAIVAAAAQPRSITQVSPDRYIILPLPDGEDTYMMRMFYALKPTRTATGMDLVILNELEETVVHTALQQLLVMPGVSWSDRELASYHAKQGLFSMTERRARANLTNSRGTMTARFPSFE
jgi:hypothetical protein